MIFNERLRQLRKENGMTQAETAQRLGIAYRNYQRLEADGNTPNFTNLVQIADLFGVSMDYLAGRTDCREGCCGAPAPVRPPEESPAEEATAEPETSAPARRQRGGRGVEHTVIISSDVAAPVKAEQWLETAVSAALAAEGVDLSCEISVLITDDEGIRQINAEQRNIDRPTDVLSFPMFELQPGEHPTERDADPETGLVPLGDMVISLERARRQATEYGHGLEREVSYLAVHSVLHLLGYDHVDEGPEKARMREREEAILDGLGITREEKGQ